MSVSVALSLGLLDAATVAVLASVPDAEGLTFAITVNVAVPPGSSVTVVLMSPVPEGAATLDPLDAVAVHVSVSTAAGIASLTTADAAVESPLFETTIV